MNITYRPFTPTDHSMLSTYITALYEEDIEGQEMTEEKIQKTFQHLSEHPDKGTIMAFEVENEVIGYAILINFWSNEYGGNIITIDELYLRADFRSKGIGTDFMEYLKKEFQPVALVVEVGEENPKAMQFYERIGFKPFKNHHLIYVVS